jgi:hypothetical protein
LLLFEIVHTHSLSEKWHEFVDTTLAAETAVQSTPLGGFNMQSSGFDMMNSHRPGLADEGYMMGDDGEGPPVPPRGMLGGGDVIHMDDNDLDIAASLMAGLSLGRAVATEGDEDNSNNSGDSEKSYNSGETASEKTGYAFDDPLGKTGGLGIELGKLTQYSQGVAEANVNTGDDDGSHSSDEESDSPISSGDVPVMDLFAGNFNYDQSTDRESSLIPVAEFANFADFDVSGSDDVGVFGDLAETKEASSLNEGDQNAQTNSSELDDLFGKGDHAQLLELEDSAPLSEILPPVVLVNPLSPVIDAPEDVADTSSSDSKVHVSTELVVDLSRAEQQKVANDEPMYDDAVLQAAPSDELLADLNEIMPGDSTNEGLTEI